MAEPIRIRGQLLPDPNSCAFHVDFALVEDDWTVVCRRGEDSAGSALIDSLLEVEGICGVQVRQHTITLWKDVSDSWQQLAARVVPAIQGALGQSDRPAISEQAVSAVKEASLEDIQPTVEQLFDRQINPALSRHGGFARVVRVEERDVFIEMGGGCQGCAASKATLRHGIESAIRQVLPQVREVVDVTDHAAGENPFYS